MKIRSLGQFICKFAREEDGPTATEYAVCLSLMILACFLTVTALGTKTNDLFPDLANVL